MIPLYPAGDFDDEARLVDSLGSFWTRVFGDQDLLAGLAAAAVDGHRQSQQTMGEALDALSVHTLQLLSLRHWFPYVVTSSMRNSNDSAVPLYGEHWLYGDAIEYGRAASSPLFSFPAPPGLVKVAAISGRTKDATEELVHGVDFWLRDGRLVFLRDPLTSGLFPVKEFQDSQECLLLLAEAEFDRGRLANSFGFLLGAGVASTEGWLQATRAFLSCAVLGPSALRIRAFLSAAFGIPVAEEAGVIQMIRESDEGTWVATAEKVYPFPAGTLPSVAVGDTVAPGDSLVQALTVVDGCDVSDTVSSLPGIVTGGLLFENKDEEVSYLGTRDGYAEVTFPVRGDAAAVSAFWDGVHARGVAAGRTLAHFLDTRTNKVGEPRAENMPSTVNPMLLVYSMLSSSVFVQVEAAAMSNPLGSPALRALHKVLPPFAGFVVNIVADTEDSAATSESSSPEALVPPALAGSGSGYEFSRPAASTR